MQIPKIVEGRRTPSAQYAELHLPSGRIVGAFVPHDQNKSKFLDARVRTLTTPFVPKTELEQLQQRVFEFIHEG